MHYHISHHWLPISERAAYCIVFYDVYLWLCLQRYTERPGRRKEGGCVYSGGDCFRSAVCAEMASQVGEEGLEVLERRKR